MSDFTKVAFYRGLHKNAHIIDALVQYEPPAHWVPAIADFNKCRNLDGLMTMANISPAAWQAYLVEKYDFDPAAPTQEGLLKAGVPADRVAFALGDAVDRSEEWADPEALLWSYDEGKPTYLQPAQIEEIIAESRGRGTPVIVFEAPTDAIEKALSDDNEITITGVNGIYIGLSDPINGYGWSAQNFTGPVTFRPATDGLTILGEHQVFEHVVEDAYRANIAFQLGEPLRFSSRSEETMRFGPPPVRDERELARTFGI
jgi:hypothetical protein